MKRFLSKCVYIFIAAIILIAIFLRVGMRADPEKDRRLNKKNGKGYI